MGVQKEWICFGHGEFESEEGVCPRGCSTVERAFRTPVGVRGERTRNIDRTLDTLATSYGATDFHNDGGRGAARVHSTAHKAAMSQQEAYREHLARKFPGMTLAETPNGTGAWGAVAKGGVYQQGGNIVDAQRGPGAPATLSASGAPATNAVAEVKEALVAPRVIGKRDPDQSVALKVRVA